jgi:hypothetical protein
MAKKSKLPIKDIEELFVWPGYVVKVETTADRGYKITLHSQELTPVAGSKLLMLKDKYVNVCLKEGNIVEADLIDVPDEVPRQKGDKTQGQRLRGVLYVLWQKMGSPGTSEEFYQVKMESLIEQIKERIRGYE